MTSKTKCNDVSGNHNHGTCKNLTSATGPAGRQNMSLEFTGNSDSYMLISDPKGLDVGKHGTGSFTYTSYVYSTRDDAVFIEWWEYRRQLHIWSYPYRNLYFHMVFLYRDGYGWTRSLNSPLYQWHFFGVIYDNTNTTAVLTLKVDSAVTSFNVPKGRPYTSGTNIYIGKRPSSTVFRGKMSCVMLFDKALDLTELGDVQRFCLRQPN